MTNTTIVNQITDLLAIKNPVPPIPGLARELLQRAVERLTNAKDENKVRCVNAHDRCHLGGPCPYCEPLDLPNPVPVDRDVLTVELDTIAKQVARWASYDREQRDLAGLMTADDTHIVSPPVWPSHGQLAAWVATLNRAKDALSE